MPGTIGNKMLKLFFEDYIGHISHPKNTHTYFVK